jgi:hypothetical protein
VISIAITPAAGTAAQASEMAESNKTTIMMVKKEKPVKGMIFERVFIYCSFSIPVDL